MLAPGSVHTYSYGMGEVAKWVALVFVPLLALSPVFEIFDKTDTLAQDGSDLARYVICLFCFLGFSLRRGGVMIARVASLRNWIIGPIQRPPIEGKLCALFLQTAKDRGLFLTFHDLRI